MNNITIPSNIFSLSQLLDDGLLLCNKKGFIISSNTIAQNFLSKKIINKNIFDFIEISEFKNLEESDLKGDLNDAIEETRTYDKKFRTQWVLLVFLTPIILSIILYLIRLNDNISN